MKNFNVNVLVFCRFKPNEGVIVVGATNFAEALDKYVYLSNTFYQYRLSFVQEVKPIV